MKTISWILLFSFFIYSCSSIYTISHTQSDYLELNEELEGKQATITLVNDTIIVGENFGISADFTSWNETAHSGSSPTKKYVNTLAIKQIDINNRTKSSTIWGIGGALAGMLTFALIYEEPKENTRMEGLENTAEALGLTFLWFFIGGVAGGLIGYGIGYPETYNFIASKDSTDLRTDIVEYYKEDKYNDEIEPIPETEVEPPILQSDGNYKINVSSLKWEKEVIIVTWPRKRIVLPKSEVVKSWKSGDKGYIIIPSEIYEREFKENDK